MRNILKKATKRLLAFCFFLCLVWQIFIHLTYLFRNAGEERLNFLTFEEEIPESLDAVYLGASSVQVFWDPMYAWDAYGIASYGYTTSNMPATCFLPLIKRISKSMDPKLFIVDIRTFFSGIWDTLGSEGIVNNGGYKSIVDSLDFSPVRLDCINYTCKINPRSKMDAIYSYIDLAYYHTNTSVLTNENNWKFWNNSTNGVVSRVSYKGFLSYQWTAQVAVFQDFMPYETKETAPLNPEAERCFQELLDYCTKYEIPLLITESPFVNNEHYAKETNSFAAICEEYRVPFINTNTVDYWAEIGLNSATDFYNKDHVNVLGAEKYTRFLADYLTRKYDLIDHRKDPMYESWWKLYNESYLPYIDSLKKYAKSIIQEYLASIEAERKMLEADNAIEWLNLADNENMTLLMVADKPLHYYPSAETELVLKPFGIEPFIEGKGSGLVAVYSVESLYADASITSYEGSTVQSNNSGRSVNYFVSNNGEINISVGDNMILNNLQGNIGIVAVDNNLMKVVDAVELFINEDGGLSMLHLKWDNQSYP